MSIISDSTPESGNGNGGTHVFTWERGSGDSATSAHKNLDVLNSVSPLGIMLPQVVWSEVGMLQFSPAGAWCLPKPLGDRLYPILYIL